MTWNEAAILALRVDWAAGLPTAVIGRRLGVSKNAVVGKAHRLELDARPSPIKRSPQAIDATDEIKSIPRIPPPTLPPLMASRPLMPLAFNQPPAPPKPTIMGAHPTISWRIEAKPVAANPIPLRAAAPPPVRHQPVGRVRECQWPTGEPGTRGFRFCAGGALLGKPYCEEHDKKAHQKKHEREKEDV